MGKWNYCVRIVIKIANFEINRRFTSLSFGSESTLYVSEQVDLLFLVEMCEPDGSVASDIFSMG